MGTEKIKTTSIKKDYILEVHIIYTPQEYITVNGKGQLLSQRLITLQNSSCASKSGTRKTHNTNGDVSGPISFPPEKFKAVQTTLIFLQLQDNCSQTQVLYS